MGTGRILCKEFAWGKMPDVIFAGTEVRKALNYAEVAVTLDNSDGFIAGVGETIRVERHIYRNGDNDYLINGRKVRLRDIRDLFMDTGLGRDSFLLFLKVVLRLFLMPNLRIAVLFSRKLQVFLNIRYVRKKPKASLIKLRIILIDWKISSMS